MSEEAKRIWDVILGALQLFAVIVGALWAYFRFRIERTDKPRIEFEVDCKFLGPVQNNYLAAFEIRANNKGQVEHRFEEIRLKVLGIKDHDELKELLGHEPILRFPNELIRDANLVPKAFGYYFVRPNVNQVFSFVTKIDAEYRFLIARATFKYKDSGDLHTAERVFEVRHASYEVPKRDDGTDRR